MMCKMVAREGETSLRHRWSRLTAVCLVFASALAALLLVSRPAEADSFSLGFTTKVRAGKNPAIRMKAIADVTKATLDLTRSDGKKFFYPLGTMREGATKKIELDGTPGKFTYRGTLIAEVDGAEESIPIKFTAVVALPLKIELDKSKVDLKRRRLELKLSRTAGHVKLKVLGLGNQVIAQKDYDFKGKPAGTPLQIKWSASGKQEVVRIEIRAYDSDGFFSGIAIVPWAVRIPHRQVNFKTDSAKIRKSEEPKLEDSYGKITDALRRYREIQGVKLFIAGHTDTVATAAYNLALSRRRAHSIASWFAKRGLKIPIYSTGFGEYSLLIKTRDNVDEERNRRVDYILAIEPPTLKTSKGYTPGWKKVQ